MGGRNLQKRRKETNLQKKASTSLKLAAESLFNLIPIVSYILVLACPYATIIASGVSLMLLLLPTGIYAAALILYLVYNKITAEPEEEQFPTYRKRFTHKSKLGVSLKMEDIHEVAIYLAEVEDYIERQGHKYEKQA